MSGPAADAALRQTERALYDAMVAKDRAALERILAPDLVYVHSTGVAESRQAYLDGVAAGLYDYESVASRDVRVRRHGTVAMIDGVCDMRVGKRGEARESISLLFVLVFVRDGDAWRLAHRHATRLPLSGR